MTNNSQQSNQEPQQSQEQQPNQEIPEQQSTVNQKSEIFITCDGLPKGLPTQEQMRLRKLKE